MSIRVLLVDDHALARNGLRMPELDGISATREIAGGDARVRILTTFDLDEYVYDALLAPMVTRRLIDELVSARRVAPSTPPELDQLTPREREVLQLVAQGHSNQEIAELVVVEETTVKTHVSRLLAKLGLRDRVQAVIFAYEAGSSAPRNEGTCGPAGPNGSTCRASRVPASGPPGECSRAGRRGGPAGSGASRASAWCVRSNRTCLGRCMASRSRVRGRSVDELRLGGRRGSIS